MKRRARHRTIVDLRPVMRIVIPSFVCALAASGQEKADIRPAVFDSARRVVIVEPRISFGEPILLLPLSLGRDSVFILPSFLFIGEDTTVPQPILATVLEKKVDLLLPLRLQREKESQLRWLQTLLGTVRIAGGAFLAYRHIKQYGFLR
jgi:hypothetical protein